MEKFLRLLATKNDCNKSLLLLPVFIKILSSKSLQILIRCLYVNTAEEYLNKM